MQRLNRHNSGAYPDSGSSGEHENSTQGTVGKGMGTVQVQSRLYLYFYFIFRGKYNILVTKRSQFWRNSIQSKLEVESRNRDSKREIETRIRNSKSSRDVPFPTLTLETAEITVKVEHVSDQ